MASISFFDKNVIRVNRIISHMLIIAFFVGPLMFLFRTLGVFEISYHQCLVISIILFVQMVIQNSLVHTKVNPSFVKYFSLFAVGITVWAISTTRHAGVYITYALVPFLSCLYMDTGLTVLSNFLAYILMLLSQCFRAVEAMREYPLEFDTFESFFLPYSTGYTIEFILVFIVSFSIVSLFRKNIIRDSVKEKTIITMQQNYITSFANIVESHEKFTGLHVKRTSIYAGLIANALLQKGKYKDILNEEYIDLLIKAASLHDIGKIAVRDEILMKQGKYTPDEYDQMKIHCQEGCRLIEENLRGVESDDFLNMAEDVALCHHERWDGKGYPNGLKGEQIPLSARIMAVADVTDALLSKRLYKDAFGFDESMKILAEGRGSQFESAIVDAALEIRDDIHEVAMNYKDKV